MNVDIYKTETYLKSLKNFDNYVSEQIDKKVDKLLDNPDLVFPMMYQHSGYCELKIGSRYRVYCVKNENKVGVLFIIGPAINHKDNYKKSKEYRKMFNILRELDEAFKDISNNS